MIGMTCRKGRSKQETGRQLYAAFFAARGVHFFPAEINKGVDNYTIQ